MKIANSVIAMSSTHSSMSYSYQESATFARAASDDLSGAILTISQEAKLNYKESLEQYQQQYMQRGANAFGNGQQKDQHWIASVLDAGKTARGQAPVAEDDYAGEIEMLRKMLALLRGKKGLTKEELAQIRRQAGAGLRTESGAMQSLSFGASASQSIGISLGSMSIQGMGSSPKADAAGARVGAGTGAGTIAGVQPLPAGNVRGGILWERVTAFSGHTVESEFTTFASKGMVTTADGRSMEFNVELNMSRAFMSEINVLQSETYILTDPLVINLDTDMTRVSDKKFFFDIDSDGKEEEVSYAGKGSGFLALDRNGDGKINDGSELFGTKSGDGFKDLAAYDEDGNGWIDENDAIFNKLKVWVKDEDGTDRLIDLKKADVGAIYLGNADTEFTLKGDQNQTNGVIRKTGLYLKESTGKVGTIQHVDLAV